VLCAAFPIEWLFDRIRAPALRLTLVCALILPGILPIFRLHPYQYVYYNAFAGGVRGAAQRFEMDYWLTSYRELALQLNRVAEDGAGVLTIGASHTFEPYARADLRLDAPGGNAYAVIPSKWERFYREAEVLFAVERGGAVLATVKRIHDREAQ
jgi:hypothetical protein